SGQIEINLISWVGSVSNDEPLCQSELVTYLGDVEINGSGQISPVKTLLKQNPKSEYRNPKQACNKTSIKLPENPKHQTKAFRSEHCLFSPFGFVSSFEFRASKFVDPGVLCDQCARYNPLLVGKFKLVRLDLEQNWSLTLARDRSMRSATFLNGGQL
ncbi:MAG TPA: hypothetical protein VEB61_14780, partial [Candidatus Binatia bacterium]|nr:hypothetical protein [Candidatus Binatia bacterium]